MTRHRFYVGTHDKNGHKVKLVAFKAIEKMLIDRYSGFTRYDAQGGWRNDAGKVIVEESIVFEVIHAADFDDQHIAVKVRDIANQSCVLYTRGRVDGRFV